MKVESLEARRLLAAEVFISEFLAANSSTLLDGEGQASDWIEIHNGGDATADLAGWHLTDDAGDLSRWTFPSDTVSRIAPGDYLVVFASGRGTPDTAGNLHTNFSLSASGEYVGLVRPDQSVASEFGSAASPYPAQRADISFGIDPNVGTGDAARYFLAPTPGIANADGLLGFVGDTSFSVDRGYFDGPFTVQITSPTTDATIVYTTDGTPPTLNHGTQVSAAAGEAPTASILVSTTTTLRAAAFKTGYLSTNVDTQTYLFTADVVNQPQSPPGFPTAWGSAPAADYEMDPEITTDPAYAQDLHAGLRSLPALSLVSDVEQIFGVSGIYTNPQNDALEIPVSAEYLLADGSAGFQIDAGLKIAGGASRRPNNSPKHSMSLRFRSSYGDGKLDADLFQDSPVDEFNSLQLRAVYNNSWIHWDQGQRGRGTLIRDQFIRDSLLAAGQDDAGRGHFCHVYINGLYWGVYNLHERADSSHFAAYNGGDSQDYDALNGGTAIDGTLDSWSHLKTVVSGGDWSVIQTVLDVDNFIDWTLAQAYGGNADLKLNGNWRAAGGGPAGAPWRMFAWDSERVLEGVTAKSPETITDATGLLAGLMQVPEFVVRLGDRIQLHFTGNGVFTPAAASARWNDRADELQTAIVAESARWGDYRRDVHPRGATPLLYRRDQHWTPEIQRLNEQYFPGRTDFVFDRFVALSWLSAVAAPQYRIDQQVRFGGTVTPGSRLRLTSPGETIYYTTDGSDPRLEGGGVSPTASVYDQTSATTTLVQAGSTWKYSDSGIDWGTQWQTASFDDSNWSSGPAELGFGDGDESTVISFGGDASNKHTTTYFRKSFNVSSTDFTELILRVRRDDGVVVYLNGSEIARNNLPSGGIDYGTFALAAAPDDGQTWLTFDVAPSSLVDGINVLAVEIHQNSPTSSDISFDAELVANQQTSPPIILDSSVQIRSRARSTSGEWSAIHDALFIVPNEPASAANLRISEIHYHPETDGDAEFLEFQNITWGEHAATVDLDGVILTDGPSAPFVFPANTQLAPGETALLVRDVVAFRAAYPNVAPSRIVGEYSGGLSNSGERIRLVAADGSEISEIEYGTRDPWPRWADGLGGSLVLKDPRATPANQVGKPYRYAGSRQRGGTPGTVASEPADIVINEVLAHTDVPLKDSIELHNTTEQPIEVGGWFLSDDGATPRKYRIADSTRIQPGGFLVLDESDFNPALPNATSLVPFALSGAGGDSVWLFSVDETDSTRFADHVSFAATFNGISIGPMAGSGGRFVPLANRSLGTINGTFLPSDLVLSEIHYHPADPSPAALAIDPNMGAKDLEFVEIVNAAGRTVPLANWRLRGEVDFDFPSSQQMVADEVLVLVSFDPSDPNAANRLGAFRTQYGLDESVAIVGPFTGSLSNSHGIIKLQAPDDPPQDEPALIPRVTVDEVFYDDLSPWPTTADGQGPSLQRIAAVTLGMFADSWRGESPTPGNLPVRPKVDFVTVNGGEQQRSTVESLEVHFDQSVTGPNSAFVITHRETQTTVGDFQVGWAGENGKSVATITFGSGPAVLNRAAGNSLIDGNYELRILATEIKTSGGDTSMQSDHWFGASEADKFFRFFGDTDGDRDVDGQDYGRFGATFLKSSGDPEYVPELDQDGDGDVDGQDYGNFGLRFLSSLPHG